jgi:hypothetical protein
MDTVSRGVARGGRVVKPSQAESPKGSKMGSSENKKFKNLIFALNNF